MDARLLTHRISRREDRNVHAQHPSGLAVPATIERGRDNSSLATRACPCQAPPTGSAVGTRIARQSDPRFPEATARSSFAPSGLCRLPAYASGLARSWLRCCLQAVSDPRSRGPRSVGQGRWNGGEAASSSGYAEFLVQMLGACKHSWLVHH